MTLLDLGNAALYYKVENVMIYAVPTMYIFMNLRLLYISENCPGVYCSIVSEKQQRI